jgi:hypothetical protein
LLVLRDVFAATPLDADITKFSQYLKMSAARLF